MFGVFSLGFCDLFVIYHLVIIISNYTIKKYKWKDVVAKKQKSFEDSLRRLKEISEKLEGNEVGLDDSIKLYEEGVKLAKECYTTLSEAELKIKELKSELESDIE